MKQYILNHTEQNPFLVNDYPYGFRLRTQARYYIETTPKKGDRFVFQTLNPKNNRWNTPKKSTYSNLGAMYLDEKQHVQFAGVTIYTSPEKVEAFVTEIGGMSALNEDQQKMYKQLMGIKIVETDEFSGKIKKDFAVKWGKDNQGECDEVRITFDRPDSVEVREIYKAMQSLNQKKLNEVFKIRESRIFSARPGVVRICIRGGFQLTTVSESSYKEYLASDEVVNELEKA